MGLLQVPNLDLMEYLPETSSKKFPEYSLALVLLLDQGGRLLTGTDTRWKYDYFDILARRLVHKILELPEEINPYNMSRWMGELGSTFGYWLLVRMWFQAPLCHSEAIRDHEIAAAINAEARTEVERFTKSRDPNREHRATLLYDTLAYPRWSREGPPTGPGVQLKDFAFWELMMMDVHKCIIEQYGGYPQRYASRGREATGAEMVYLERSNYFDVIDDASAKQIRSDVKAGIWTRLKCDDNPSSIH